MEEKSGELEPGLLEPRGAAAATGSSYQGGSQKREDGGGNKSGELESGLLEARQRRAAVATGDDRRSWKPEGERRMLRFYLLRFRFK